jgi:putative component of toxin-antitoxin plasmid stabilization module
MAGGMLLTMGGIGGEVLGGLFTATGIGAAIGVPAVVVSAGLVAAGMGNMAAGIWGLGQVWSMGSGSGRVAPSTPVATAAPRIVSRINESSKLVREAEAAGRSAQRSLDHLTSELARGNMNPGIGTRPIGRGLSEARARDGARVYFRQRIDGTVEILGKSTKDNQTTVINEVLRVFAP